MADDTGPTNNPDPTDGLIDMATGRPVTSSGKAPSIGSWLETALDHSDPHMQSMLNGMREASGYNGSSAAGNFWSAAADGIGAATVDGVKNAWNTAILLGGPAAGVDRWFDAVIDQGMRTSQDLTDVNQTADELQTAYDQDGVAGLSGELVGRYGPAVAANAAGGPVAGSAIGKLGMLTKGLSMTAKGRELSKLIEKALTYLKLKKEKAAATQTADGGGHIGSGKNDKSKGKKGAVAPFPRPPKGDILEEKDLPNGWKLLRVDTDDGHGGKTDYFKAYIKRYADELPAKNPNVTAADVKHIIESAEAADYPFYIALDETGKPAYGFRVAEANGDGYFPLQSDMLNAESNALQAGQIGQQMLEHGNINQGINAMGDAADAWVGPAKDIDAIAMMQQDGVQYFEVKALLSLSNDAPPGSFNNPIRAALGDGEVGKIWVANSTQSGMYAGMPGQSGVNLYQGLYTGDGNMQFGIAAQDVADNPGMGRAGLKLSNVTKKDPGVIKTAADLPPPKAPKPPPPAAPSTTGTVWDDIKPTQPNYPGGELPVSFELQAGNQRVWVNGNATEHIAERAASAAELHTPDNVRLLQQEQLRSLQSAVTTATDGGVPLNELLVVDGWELKFGPSQKAGGLPVLFHAQTVK